MALWERAAVAIGERVTSSNFCNRIVFNVSRCDCHNFLPAPTERTVLLPYFKGNMPLWVRHTLIMNVTTSAKLIQLPFYSLDQNRKYRLPDFFPDLGIFVSILN